MIFFTSDLHFGHYRIIEYCNRPFDSLGQMNEYMVEKWNETVSPTDTVYVLGDFSLGKEWVRKYVPRLNGTKHLIAGNHDWCHPVCSKSLEKRQRMTNMYLESGFASVKLEDTIEIAGQIVKMHHMPYRSDHTKDERYKELRPKDEGGWLLHGHVHTIWKQRGKEINVGVDVNNFTPIPITEIERIINEKK